MQKGSEEFYEFLEALRKVPSRPIGNPADDCCSSIVALQVETQRRIDEAMMVVADVENRRTSDRLATAA